MEKQKSKGKQKNKTDDDAEIALTRLENQVADVKITMRDNISKMHEREGKLEDLESRANILAEQTTVEFRKLATKTRRKAQMKTRRFYIILICIIVVCVSVIIVIITLYSTGVLSGS